MTESLEFIKNDVSNLLREDNTGHSIDHVDRVYRLAVELAEKEGADINVVQLAALLHDVDDYKLFGVENAEQLTNARSILDRYCIDQKLAQHVLSIIPSMGYNKYLEGVRPKTLEGKIVSDADMCDAIGSQGLIRVFEYNASKAKPFFDPSIPPSVVDVAIEEYKAGSNDHAVQHFFDKLLIIPDILMTEAGRQEGQKRAAIMQDFLRELFREEDARAWSVHLKKYLQAHKQ